MSLRQKRNLHRTRNLRCCSWRTSRASGWRMGTKSRRKQDSGERVPVGHSAIVKPSCFWLPCFLLFSCFCSLFHVVGALHEKSKTHLRLLRIVILRTPFKAQRHRGSVYFLCFGPQHIFSGSTTLLHVASKPFQRCFRSGSFRVWHRRRRCSVA